MNESHREVLGWNTTGSTGSFPAEGAALVASLEDLRQLMSIVDRFHQLEEPSVKTSQCDTCESTTEMKIPNVYCIMCTDKTTGKIGDFAYHEDEPFVAVSPVFPNFIEFLDWLKDNNLRTASIKGKWNCLVQK